MIRTIVETLTRRGACRPTSRPSAGAIVLTRNPDGTWYRGQHSSNPPGLDAA